MIIKVMLYKTAVISKENGNFDIKDFSSSITRINFSFSAHTQVLKISQGRQQQVQMCMLINWKMIVHKSYALFKKS